MSEMESISTYGSSYLFYFSHKSVHFFLFILLVNGAKKL